MLPAIDRALVLSVLGSVVLGTGITSAGIAIARSDAPAVPIASSTESAPAESEPAPAAASGKSGAKRKPVKTAMTCKGAACILVFDTSDPKPLKPFGTPVELSSTSAKKVELSSGGMKYDVEPGKAGDVGTAKATVVGTPTDSSVTLAFRKGA